MGCSEATCHDSYSNYLCFIRLHYPVTYTVSIEARGGGDAAWRWLKLATVIEMLLVHVTVEDTRNNHLHAVWIRRGHAILAR